MQRRVAQIEAGLARIEDVLAKYDALAPLDGVVTDLPVRVGETVVPGVQNSAASTIMTIADMSLITAEVKVDETDIVNVHLGQIANVTIDAMPESHLHGQSDRDRQHGDPAFHRTGRVAKRDFQPGSQGFQGRDRARSAARRNSAGPVVHREDRHGDAPQRAVDSDPGADGAQER